MKGRIVVAERKSRFCNLLWDGHFPTAPLRAVKRRAKTLVSVWSDHLKPKSGAERPPKPHRISSPQTRSTPRIAGRCGSERGRLRPRSFILCKNRTGTGQVKVQPFRASCACVRGVFPSVLPQDGRCRRAAFNNAFLLRKGASSLTGVVSHSLPAFERGHKSQTTARQGWQRGEGGVSRPRMSFSSVAVAEPALSASDLQH